MGIDHVTREQLAKIEEMNQTEWEQFCQDKRITASEQQDIIDSAALTLQSVKIVKSVANVSIYETYIGNLGGRGEAIRKEIDNTRIRMITRQSDDKDVEKQKQNYGLVVGRIQSGKTAHMLGLAFLCLSNPSKLKNPNLRDENISPASVVIILTGLIDDLRIQTYNRLKSNLEGFDYTDFIVGPSSKSDITGDKKFQQKLKLYFSTKNNKKQLIIVMKKNSKVIEKLLTLLQGQKNAHHCRLNDVIIIDDECDYASMDSNNADQNMSKTETATNKIIRELIQEFRCKFHTICWYIGYTATSFSNILSNPHGVSSDGLPTLFPRGFIYPLKKNKNHLDNEFYFTDDDAKKHVYFITDNGGVEEIISSEEGTGQLTMGEEE